MKKNTNTNTNEAMNEEIKKAVEEKISEMTMFELMKIIDHNTKKVNQLKAKIERLQSANEMLKTQLKSKIETI